MLCYPIQFNTLRKGKLIFLPSIINPYHRYSFKNTADNLAKFCFFCVAVKDVTCLRDEKCIIKRSLGNQPTCVKENGRLAKIFSRFIFQTSDQRLQKL